jgi:hypothetical protein
MADLLAAKTRAEELDAAKIVVAQPAAKSGWSLNSSEAQYMW